MAQRTGKTGVADFGHNYLLADLSVASFGTLSGIEKHWKLARHKTHFSIMTPMLIIRAAQMQAFSRAVSDNLIESAVEHIRTSLPEMFEQLGREEVRESVLFAMRKADEYGLDDWSQVVRYLNVMYRRAPTRTKRRNC
jgi:hypothetical protein